MASKKRREFIKSALLGSGVLVTGRWGSELQVHKGKNPDKKIIRRTLGKTGIDLPVVSLGVMRADNPSLVQAALDAGMEHLDTAHAYQGGKNEEMLGELLKERPRDSFVIGTKIVPGDRDRKTGLLGPGSTKKAFMERLETSLDRLQMDHVDILYLHAISTRQATLFEPMLDALTTAKKQSKARFVGLSTHSNEPEVIQAALDSGIYDVVLTAINFKQQHFEEMQKVIKKASGKGLGIIGMKTMAGAYHDKEKTRPIDCKAALKWVLQNEHVHTTIPGIKTFQQLEENASVMYDTGLTDDEIMHLEQGKLEAGLFCQGCHICADQCVERLPVSDMMRAYMYAHGYGETIKAKKLLAEHGTPKGLCQDCDACSVNCASLFNIKDRIMDVSRLMDVPDEFLV